jgi:broad specificity polyphosphatase/5'/3'-nucleotidase SurE
LAAAKQAVLLGTRAIALSTPVDDNEPEFTALEPSIKMVLHLLIPQQKPALLNVNLPVYFPAKGIRIMDKGDLHFLAPILRFESE